MNIIKRTGENTFEINASPETMQWLEEMSRVANADLEHVLNSALTQAWGGWASYRRRAYELELENVQAQQAVAGDTDKPEGPVEAAKPSSMHIEFIPIDLSLLKDIQPGFTMEEFFRNNSDPSKASAENTNEEFLKPKSVDEAFVNLIYGVLDTVLPKENRDNLRGAFTRIKERMKQETASAETIAKQAMDRAFDQSANETTGNSFKKCACGSPFCQNEFTLDEMKQLMLAKIDGNFPEVLKSIKAKK